MQRTSELIVAGVPVVEHESCIEIVAKIASTINYNINVDTLKAFRRVFRSEMDKYLKLWQKSNELKSSNEVASSSKQLQNSSEDLENSDVPNKLNDESTLPLRRYESEAEGDVE
ncbi:hypothetical protein Bhyg_12011, partial [Pseudolycoriella hygida]